MKPIIYSLQFRGRASSVRSDVLTFRLSAPSSAFLTTVGHDGVRGSIEDLVGREALFESELMLDVPSAFREAGTVDFGRGNLVRFRSVANGTLTTCPDPNLRRGAIVAEVQGGEGQFAAAEGFITSNFLVSDTGEVTDNQLGLIFVEDRLHESGRREQHVHHSHA
jgi:hypothetical protein